MTNEASYVPIRGNPGPVEDAGIDEANFALSNRIRSRTFLCSKDVLLSIIVALLLILSFVCGSVLRPIDVSSEMKSRPDSIQSELDNPMGFFDGRYTSKPLISVMMVDLRKSMNVEASPITIINLKLGRRRRRSVKQPSRCMAVDLQ